MSLPNTPEHSTARQLATHAPTAATWDGFVRDALEPEWLAAYRAATSWTTEVQEIRQGALVFLFDAAPTLKPAPQSGDDRVAPSGAIHPLPSGDATALGLPAFLPNPLSWSRAGLDRGHFIAHAAGGGLDLNLFPQARSLNRGRSPEGRLWRRMESHAARHPGTPLFVHPVYRDSTWRPVTIELGLLVRRDGLVRALLERVALGVRGDEGNCPGGDAVMRRVRREGGRCGRRMACLSGRRNRRRRGRSRDSLPRLRRA